MVKNPFTNKDIGILTQFVRFKTLTDNRKQELLDELSCDDARIVADCLINPENDVPEQFSELINSINKWGSPGVRKQRLPFFKQQQHTARSSSG